MFTDKVRMIYLQLPCFTKSEVECNTLFDCFIYTLKNMEILDRMPFMAKNAVFKKLAEIADVNMLTQEEYEKYDSSIKVLRDNIAVYQGAIREGEMKGMEEGIKTGLAKGRQEGRIETIKMLLASGMPIEQIATALNVDIEELKALIV